MREQRRHVTRRGTYIGALVMDHAVREKTLRLVVRSKFGETVQADFRKRPIGDEISVWETDATDDTLKLLAEAGAFQFFRS